ncbi:MAG TPA: polymer-forming cytoskeletal protein [Rhizomicrobium sp.]
MFSSKKETPPAAANAPPAKRAARSSAPSIISADLIVTGTLTSTGDIQIDGRVDGDVHSAGLVIGDKAYINGEILAEEVTIRGRVHGSIRARKVLLCSTSHVEGNILHEAFAVETGAFFEGNCRHADNPLAEDVAKKTTEMRATPAAPASAGPGPGAPSNTPSAISSMVTRPLATDTSRPAAPSSFAPLKSNA